MATSQQQKQEGSLNKVEKPVFVVLDQIKPGTRGRKVIAKVLTSNTAKQSKSLAVYHNVRHNCIAECLIGDEPATILYTARNDQGSKFKPLPLSLSL